MTEQQKCATCGHAASDHHREGSRYGKQQRCYDCIASVATHPFVPATPDTPTRDEGWKHTEAWLRGRFEGRYETETWTFDELLRFAKSVYRKARIDERQRTKGEGR